MTLTATEKEKLLDDLRAIERPYHAGDIRVFAVLNHAILEVMNLDEEHRQAEPEKRPCCPKCGKELTAMVVTGGIEPLSAMECKHCWNWSQPDFEQRPPMPKPRDGYHAGECRSPRNGENYFSLNGSGINTRVGDACESELKSKDNYYDLRWIAVPDAKPVSESVARCPEWMTGVTINGVNYPSGTCTHEGNTITVTVPISEYEAAKGNSEPVARYWRHSSGVCIKLIDDKFESGIGEWRQGTAKEYEAAKHPVKTVEPLIARCIEELQTQINELQQRLAKVEGKVNV